MFICTGSTRGKGELGEVYCRQGQEHQLCLTLVHGRNSGLKRTLLFGFFQVIPQMEAGHCSRLCVTGLNKTALASWGYVPKASQQ